MSLNWQALRYHNLVRSRPLGHAGAWRALALVALLLALGCGAPAADAEGLGQTQAPLTSNVAALFDLNSINTAPFPSDLQTRNEFGNLTGRRVHLPKPNCSQRPSDCQDIDVLNTLDGFSLQPRLRVPFNGAIDPSSVNSSTIFLVQRGDTTGGNPQNTVIGINQVVWDPSSNTLFAQPDQLLDQHTRYLLVITTGIRDPQGGTIRGGNFNPFPDPSCSVASFPVGQTDPCTYRASLLSEINAAGFNPSQVAAANMFTTQSATAVLEKIRQQIKNSSPAPAVFTLPGDGSRAVYPLSDLSGIVFNRQIGTTEFQKTDLPVALGLNVIPNSVSSIAFGRYSSPDYETAEQFIPAYGTAFGTPVVQRNNDIFFNLFLPAGPKPAGGWPVALFGHGFGDTKQGASIAVASVLASQGIATIVINVVGHGGGRAGTLIVNRSGHSAVTLPAGGRGIDQNGDGMIDPTEGVNAAPPRQIIARRDGHRQTVADLMQLVRVIETGGVDVDDGGSDLNGQRIYYFGQSFGGIYGSLFLAVEPSVRAGVLNVAGGSVTDAARLGNFRGLPALMLGSRVPSLLNALPATPPLFGFNENLPLRNQSLLINSVPGAIEIQEFFDRQQWAEQAGDCVAYARHIRKQPLHGVAAKPIILQNAKGDGTVPNPTSSALIRAGDLSDRTTFFRNDLAFAANPAIPKNPHTFLTNLQFPASAPLAVATQVQIAAFFASDGTLTIDPDGAGPLFETPIVGPLPETLNLLP